MKSRWQNIGSRLSLGKRILVSILLLMSVSISATVLLINSSIETEVQKDLLLDLEQAETIFLSTQGTESASKNSVLAKTSFVRALVMGKNLSALSQYAQKSLRSTEADILMFTDAKGSVLVRSDSKNNGEDMSSLSPVMKAIGGNVGVGLLAGATEFYQINTMPIKAGPTIKGTISLGYKINDRHVRKVSDIAKSSISFVANGVLVASVWDDDKRKDLQKKLSGLKATIQESIHSGLPSPPIDIKIGTEIFTSVFLPMPGGTEKSAAIYLIQISKDKAMVILSNVHQLMLTIAIVSFILAIAISIGVARQISAPISVLVNVANSISKGDLSVSRKVESLIQQRGDEVGILAKSFAHMITGLKEEETRQTQMAKISAMVEHSRTNIVFIDTDCNISYMNAASIATLKKVESLLPLPADDVIGHTIDTVSNDAVRIKKILSDTKSLPYTEKFSVGQEHFLVTVIAIYDPEQHWIGSMVNWSITTPEVTMRHTLSETVASLSTASEEMFESSHELTVNSEETSRQSQEVSNASISANESVQSISAASEEMSVTIKEISRSIQETSHITSQAVDMADSTNNVIRTLGNSSDEIGEVVKVINAIASQTNLLALNATIEAARAGESGKGFAVVANEVKDLAIETAKATEGISKQITSIQTGTKHAIEAIDAITTVIGKINKISLSVSGAIEEQAATASEITRHIAEAASDTNGIVEKTQDISSASVNTSTRAGHVSESSKVLSELAHRLESAMAHLDD